MNVRHEGKKLLVRLGYYSKPDFLIIGAQKAGTTLLYSYLSQHPQLLRPAFKEPHFFDRDEQFQKGKVHYFKNFELPFRFRSDQITFESTVDTIYFPWCAERVKEFLPDIRLIAVLRDPVHRAYSQWNMGHFRKAPGDRLYDPRRFEDAVSQELENGIREEDPLGYLNRGLYAKQLKRFYAQFGKDRILVIDNQEMKEDIQDVMNKITDFIGLSGLDINALGSTKDITPHIGNYSVDKGVPLEDRMRSFFREPDRKLGELLGRRFSWFDL